MNRGRCFSLLLSGLILLLASLLVACATEPQITTHISVQPDKISFSGREGQSSSGEPLEIYSSEQSAPLMWQAQDDALWLHLTPSSGTFDGGASKAVVWADTSGMSAGHYNAIVSIFVPEADNSPLAIPVDLYVETPEDPAVAAAREFWESSFYKPYWDLNASNDVIDTVRSYEFPPPGETKSISQEVEIKNVEFKYEPATHERPIAVVHCIVTFHRTYVDEHEQGWIETWTGDIDVVLQVQPAPYDTDHNEWEVIDYYSHNEASSLLFKMDTVRSGDSSSGDSGDGGSGSCGCG